VGGFGDVGCGEKFGGDVGLAEASGDEGDDEKEAGEACVALSFQCGHGQPRGEGFVS